MRYTILGLKPDSFMLLQCWMKAMDCGPSGWGGGNSSSAAVQGCQGRLASFNDIKGSQRHQLRAAWAPCRPSWLNCPLVHRPAPLSITIPTHSLTDTASCCCMAATFMPMSPRAWLGPEVAGFAAGSAAGKESPTQSTGMGAGVCQDTWPWRVGQHKAQHELFSSLYLLLRASVATAVAMVSIFTEGLQKGI